MAEQPQFDPRRPASPPPPGTDSEQQLPSPPVPGGTGGNGGSERPIAVPIVAPQPHVAAPRVSGPPAPVAPPAPYPADISVPQPPAGPAPPVAPPALAPSVAAPPREAATARGIRSRFSHRQRSPEWPLWVPLAVLAALFVGFGALMGLGLSSIGDGGSVPARREAVPRRTTSGVLDANVQAGADRDELSPEERRDLVKRQMAAERDLATQIRRADDGRLVDPTLGVVLPPPEIIELGTAGPFAEELTALRKQKQSAVTPEDFRATAERAMALAQRAAAAGDAAARDAALDVAILAAQASGDAELVRTVTGELDRTR